MSKAKRRAFALRFILSKPMAAESGHKAVKTSNSHSSAYIWYGRVRVVQ